MREHARSRVCARARMRACPGACIMPFRSPAPVELSWPPPTSALPLSHPLTPTHPPTVVTAGAVNMPLDEYARQVLPAQLFADLREAVDSNRCASGFRLPCGLGIDGHVSPRPVADI